MLEQIKKWVPPRQALLLAFIQAYGWFWIQGFSENSSTYGPNASADGGLTTIILGWFLALIWGWVVCWPLAKRMIGTQSVAGYMYSSVLFPLALWVLQIFKMIVGVHLPRAMGFPSQIPNIRKGYETLFDILGLGILREGRAGYAQIYAWMFLAMLIAGAIGFSRTMRNQERTETKA